VSAALSVFGKEKYLHQRELLAALFSFTKTQQEDLLA